MKFAQSLFTRPTIRVRLPDRKARPCVTCAPLSALLAFAAVCALRSWPRHQAASAGQATRPSPSPPTTATASQDCLGEGGECGRAVADAWCEADGRGAALSFGRADDVTGRSPTAYVVT